MIDPVSGCSNTQQIVIPESTDKPSVSLNYSGEITCAVTSLDITASSTISNAVYSWATQDGVINSGESTAKVTVKSGGTYIVTVTNPTNGCSTTDSVTINEQSTIDFDVQVSNEITCNTQLLHLQEALLLKV